MQVTSLPAGSGDCFVITWGSPARAIIIDGGRAGCYRNFLSGQLKHLADSGIKKIDLAIVSHIDEDHMEGLIEWVKSETAVFEDFWFNGRPQLPPNKKKLQVESVSQGDELSRLLAKNNMPWNKKFSGHAVVTVSSQEFPSLKLPGGLDVTVIGPGQGELQALADRWNEVPPPQIREDAEVIRLAELAGLTSKKAPASLPLQISDWAKTPWEHQDVGPTNVSSITCLIEHAGKAALFTGDADPLVVVDAWKRLETERGRKVTLDLLKLNHHGSRKNCGSALIQTLRPKKVVISSDGSIYGHPEKEALSSVITNSPGVELFFNYDNEYSQPWTAEESQKTWGYAAKAGGPHGIVIDLP